MKNGKIIWSTFVLVSFLSMFALVLKFIPYDLNSDSAFFPLLAHWEYATGRIFPEGMCYGTQVMGLSPNLFMIPYLALFGEHFLLARVLGVFSIWLIIIALLFILFGCKRYTPFCAVSILLLVPYLGSSATEEYFFEAGYVNQIKWLALALILCTSLWELLGVNEKTSKNNDFMPPGKLTAGIAILSVALFAVIVYSNSCGIRNLLITYIPMTGAIILYALMLQMDSLLSQKSSRVSVLARLVKKVLPFTGIFLAGSLCAILVYRGISARVWTFENQTPVTLAPAHIFMERVMKLVNSLLSICGNRDSAPMFSVRGISKLVNYFYAVFIYVCVPWYSIRNFGRIKEDRSRLIILTAHISSILLAFIWVTANLDIISNDESRYCLPIFVNNIFVLGALLRDEGIMQACVTDVCPADAGHAESEHDDTGHAGTMAKESMHDDTGDAGSQHDADEEAADTMIAADEYQVDVRKLLTCLFIRYLPVMIIIYAVFTHLVFWKVNMSEMKNLPDPYGLTAFLEERGLTHGYASYWNAHKNTVLSDGRVTVAGVEVKEYAIEPQYWLTNRQYYSGDFYNGPTFLVLTENEVPLFDAHGKAAETYGIPKEQLQYEDLTIYLYDYNIITK